MTWAGIKNGHQTVHSEEKNTGAGDMRTQSRGTGQCIQKEGGSNIDWERNTKKGGVKAPSSTKRVCRPGERENQGGLYSRLDFVRVRRAHKKVPTQ